MLFAAPGDLICGLLSHSLFQRKCESVAGQAGAGKDRGNLGDRVGGVRVKPQEKRVAISQSPRERAEFEDGTAPVDRAHDEAAFCEAALLGPPALQFDPHPAHHARKARSFLEPHDRC
jgi:hypothetical protein